MSAAALEETHDGLADREIAPRVAAADEDALRLLSKLALGLGAGEMADPVQYLESR